MVGSFDRVIRNFTIYRVVSRFSFYVPIYVVALLDSGFSFLAVGLILFVYGIATMTFGSRAKQSFEKRGAARTIAFGEAAKAGANLLIGAALVFFWAVDSAVAVVVLLAAQILGGAGYCYAAVGDGGYLGEAGKIFSMDRAMQARGQAQSSSCMFISFLIAGCVGALLFPIMPALPFFLTALANGAACVLCLAALDPGRSNQAPDQAGAPSARFFNRLTVPAKAHVATYAFLRATVLAMQLLILPVWFFIGLRIDVGYFGILFGLYTLAGFLGGRFYPYLEKKLSQRYSLLLVQAIIAASMLTLALADSPIGILLAPAGVFAAAGMLRPAYLPSLAQAATTEGEPVNSVAMAERIFGAMSATAYFVGAALFYFGFTPSFIVLAAAWLMAALALLSLGTIVRKPAELRQNPVR